MPVVKFLKFSYYFPTLMRPIPVSLDRLSYLHSIDTQFTKSIPILSAKLMLLLLLE